MFEYKSLLVKYLCPVSVYIVYISKQVINLKNIVESCLQMLRWNNQVCLFQYDTQNSHFYTQLKSTCVKVKNFKIVAAASFQSTNRVFEFADSEKRSTNSIQELGQNTPACSEHSALRNFGSGSRSSLLVSKRSGLTIPLRNFKSSELQPSLTQNCALSFRAPRCIRSRRVHLDSEKEKKRICYENFSPYTIIQVSSPCDLFRLIFLFFNTIYDSSVHCLICSINSETVF